MIFVDFTLLSAITGKTSPLGLMTISNIKQYRVGKDIILADYEARVYTKRTTKELILSGKAKPLRTATVLHYAKNSRPAWDLVTLALKELGYG